MQLHSHTEFDNTLVEVFQELNTSPLSDEFYQEVLNRIEPADNKITVMIHDFDIKGNCAPIAHFTMWHNGDILYTSNRRKETGYFLPYCKTVLESAVEITGKKWKVASYFGGKRNNGKVIALLEEIEND